MSDRARADKWLRQLAAERAHEQRPTVTAPALRAGGVMDALAADLAGEPRPAAPPAPAPVLSPGAQRAEATGRRLADRIRRFRTPELPAAR